MEFPGVLANNDVSLDIRKGEVFALVGENGAGKTTLMNILYGIHEPTNGEVYIRGRKVERFSPKTAISMGVGMVHQHFMLVPSFTVAQNIVMSREPRRLGVLFDNKAAEAAAQKLVEEKFSKRSTAVRTFSFWTSRPPSSPRRRRTSCSPSSAAWCASWA